MQKTITVLPGDGVGPEVTNEAVKVIETIAKKFNHTFSYKNGLIGAIAIDKTGNPLPQETIDICLKSDAILFGAIGDPKYDNDPTLKIRPEQGLLKLRKTLGLFANVRPISVFKSMISKSPLKPEIVNGVDFVVIRELIGGIYFGKHGRKDNGKEAFDICSYTEAEISRVVKYAFELALKRKKKLTVVDKANVLETSRLWRETVQKMMSNYPSIEINFMFVDNASMQIIKRPTDFDVIVTENMFGDILTDEASVITGSIGMLPSASIGMKSSLYEPIHGSFPKAAGKNIANPIGAILSAAMMFEFSFQLFKEAKIIRQAVEKVLEKGYGTKDIMSENPVSTSEMGDLIVKDIIS
ncbi:MAG: 3-isopropylmalate dehydrogenase [bacterium]|nr:3-isopropylmalate dehydrogenase [bacterium]